MITLLLFFLPAFAASAEPVNTGPASFGWAGVYKYRFQNALVGGEKYQSEDILELVPFNATHMYFRISARFANGHSCSIWGMAEATDISLNYRKVAEPGQDACEMEIREENGMMVSKDVGGLCRKEYCGARGLLDLPAGKKGGWKISEKKKIRYMDRLKKSEQYKEAVKEFNERKKAK